MFRRLLIANRGEVAARIQRTCKRMGIETVAVASHADRDAQWLSAADHVVCIGPAASQKSYLDQDALFEVAARTACSAVHPGWGFLAENATFAARCRDRGLTFVGPDPAHLRRFGDKVAARETMAQLGLPPIPGTHHAFADVDEAKATAQTLGFPVLLKALAGGGGRGMRRANAPDEVASAYAEASAEAQAGFGDGRLYMERLIEGGRHIEVQVLGDHYGTVHTFGERECSLQRRHQKVLEESPSPGLSSEERDRIMPQIVSALSSAGYTNAGTVEMLLDAHGKLWFMEMNTRLQVEHPVTEARTGLDLVEWQLRVAANEPLFATPPTLRGHAMEFRINAEDPQRGFRPSPGQLTALHWPEGEGIRLDTHLTVGDRIPPNYDSMIAKLIVSGESRSVVCERAEKALAAVRVEGVQTNVGLHRRLVVWDRFVAGDTHTASLETFLKESADGAA